MPESRELYLHTLSPIHIGSGEQSLFRSDYIHSGTYCYVIDDEKLSLFLSRKDLINDFVNEVTANRRFDLFNFLRNTRDITFDHETLTEISKYIVPSPHHGDIRLWDPRPFIRDGNHDIFIPGSSIKGAIRTAVAYSILKKWKSDNESKFNEILIEPVKKKLKEFANEDPQKKERGWFINLFKKFFAEDVDQKLFQNFKLPGERKANPRTDIFRALTVSDALPIDDAESYLQVIRILSKSGSGWNYSQKKTRQGGDLEIYAECVDEGQNFRFTLFWDDQTLQAFEEHNRGQLPFQSLDEVLKMCQEFTADVRDKEKDFIENLHDETNLGDVLDFYQNLEPDLRMGWGSGMLGTTLITLLPNEMRLEIRDNFFEKRNIDEFPKSRHIIFEDEFLTLPLGWCKFLDEPKRSSKTGRKDSKPISSSSGQKSTETEPAKTKLAAELEKKLELLQAQSKQKTKSRYKKGHVIKRCPFRQEGEVYKVEIKGQDEPATLIGKPPFGAKVINVKVDKIEDGVITKVRKEK